MYPLDPHGVKKWGDMTLPAPMDAPPMAKAISLNPVGHSLHTPKISTPIPLYSPP